MNILKEKKSFKTKFCHFVVYKPYHSLGLLILISLIILPGALKIKSTYTPRMWFAKDHPQIVALDKFEKLFGNDQKTSIGIHNPNGIFNLETLTLIQQMTEELWQVKDVVRVESLANHSHISATENDISIEPFLSEDLKSLSSETISKLKVKALNDEFIPDYFVSHDGTYALIFGHLKPAFDGDPDYELIVNETQKIIDSHLTQVPGVELYLLGDSTANEAFRQVAKEDNEKIIPLLFLLILLILAWLFRDWPTVIMPLALSFLIIGITYGFEGYIGMTYNSMLAAIPGIMLAICIADSVHILMSYFHYLKEGIEPKKALIVSLEKNFQPTLMTSVTTAVSFISISFTEITPIRDLGILSCIGTMMAWIFTYLLIGPVISLLEKRYQQQKFKINDNKNNQTSEFVLKYTQFLKKYSNHIIAFSFGLTLVSIHFSLKNEINSDPLKYFTPEVPLRAAFDFATTKLNGIRGAELIIDSGKEEGVKSPDFLKRLDSFQIWLKTQPEVSQTRSIVEVIKKLNKVVHGDESTFQKIPDEQNQIAELLLLYQMSLPPGMDLNNQISLNNQKLRFRILWNIQTSKESIEFLDKVLAKANEFNLKIEVGGNLPIYTKINQLIVISFFWSLVGALAFVSFLLLLTFKDPLISFLAILPNLLPMLVGGALIYFMDVYIDIGTSMVIVVCLGIAVDDTIHFIANFKHYRSENFSVTEAIEKTLFRTGKALILTTVLLTVGFGSFILADFAPNKTFGILCAQILVVALLADLILLPALLIKIRDKKRVHE